jgi:hypothetical protein
MSQMDEPSFGKWMTATTINNQVKHHHSSINSSYFPMAAEVDAAGRVEAPPSRQPF